MIKMARNPWFLLFFGSLWVGSGAEGATNTQVTVKFVSDDGTTITNGSFKYRQEHGVDAANSGHFKFLNSADLHALNYTFNPGSGVGSTIEGCAGATCNLKYDIFTNFMTTPKAYHMDVEWRSGSNTFVDFIDLETLTSLDLNHLPGCDAFKSPDGTVFAHGTFTRKVNTGASTTTHITVTDATCVVTMAETVVFCPQPTPVVYCPVYAPPMQHGCRLTALFARHRFRLCRR
jgi:hypothetical protein